MGKLTHKLIVQRRNKEDNGQETAFKFSDFLFNSTISKKLKTRTYKLPFSTERVVFNGYRRSEVLDRLDNGVFKKYKELDSNEHSIRCYQLKMKQLEIFS